MDKEQDAGIEVVDATDGKTQKVSILARTNKPVYIPGIGNFIHDFATMKMKEKIPIDYAHDTYETLGYARLRGISDKGLELDGTIIPFEDGDRASEIVYKLRAGQPYESSIMHDGEYDLLEIHESHAMVINGMKVDGPAYVVQNWTLRGVAVCPYGRDKNTNTQIALSDILKSSFESLKHHKTEGAKMPETKHAEEQKYSVTQFEQIEAECGTQLAVIAMKSGKDIEWARCEKAANERADLEKEVEALRLYKADADSKMIRMCELQDENKAMRAKLESIALSTQSQPVIPFDKAEKKNGKVTSIFKRG